MDRSLSLGGRGRRTRRAMFSTALPALGLLAAACGAGEQTTPTGTSGTTGAAPAAPAQPSAAAQTLRGGVPANPSAKGTVAFMHGWGSTRLPLMEQQIIDFQKLWPEIKVDAELLAVPSMNEKYLAVIAGGNPPDVIMLNHDLVPAYGGRGALVSLDTYLTRDKLRQEDIFYETDYKLTNYKGKPVSMPQATSGGWYMLVYNGAAFKSGGVEKAPKTWEELEVASAKINQLEGGKAKTLGLDVTYHNNYPTFKQWLYTNGGTLISADGKKVTFNGPEGQETLTWMLDFQEKLGGFGVVQGLKAEMGSMVDAFYNQRVAMQVHGVWIFKEAKAAAPSVDFQAAILPVNGKRPGTRSQNVADTGWGYAIPKGAKNPDAGWEWIKYISPGEGNLNFFKAQLRPSPVKKYNEDPFFARENPHWPVVQEILKTSTSYPITGVQAELNKALADMTEEVMLKRKSPSAALADAARAAQLLLDDWNSRAG